MNTALSRLDTLWNCKRKMCKDKIEEKLKTCSKFPKSVCSMDASDPELISCTVRNCMEELTAYLLAMADLLDGECDAGVSGACKRGQQLRKLALKKKFTQKDYLLSRQTYDPFFEAGLRKRGSPPKHF